MTIDALNPGKGYVPRESLGGGRWKKAYRAISQMEMDDVALLVFGDTGSNADMLKELEPLFSIRNTSYSEYVAATMSVFIGLDGRVYFVEELISMPLDKVAPLKSGEMFLRIARDLSRGLQCLHAAGLIHRDIKLDNCGIDVSGRAKVFDLGNVTSDGRPMKGTIFTRAPELLDEKQAHTKACDVWALGATLFALRTGDYPFVNAHEAAERRPLAEKAREGILSREEEERREAMNKAIMARYDCGKLKERTMAAFPGEPGEVLCKMLEFDVGLRPAAEECALIWNDLLLNWINPPKEHEETRPEALSSLEGYLTAVCHGRIGITDKQWDAVTDVWASLNSYHDGDIGKRVRPLMEKVKMMRSEQSAAADARVDS